MAGPTFPVPVPNEGEKVSWPGDQKMPEDGTGFYQSHNGGMKKWEDRSRQGTDLRDPYQWEEG